MIRLVWQYIGELTIKQNQSGMKKIIVMLGAAFVFAACNNSAENTTTTDSTNIQTTDSLSSRPDNNQLTPNASSPSDTMGGRRDSLNGR
jgi:hypothetical protein